MSAPDQVLGLFFQELLIHKQYQLVGEFYIRMNGEKRSLPNASPIYYAYLRLAKIETPSIEAMPPEFEEVVDDIVKQVIERQKVYYPVKV